ncbi:MAG: LamG-like jellyroll fold domain-containing protein, partial [Candidatus Ornithomonoglobus sp.]
MKKKLTALLCAVAVTVSALPVIPAFAAASVSDESGLISALSIGGDYEMTADIAAANAGINDTATTGTLSGNGHTLTKSNSKWGDAILYQNRPGNWTFSDMTIDGSKSMGTFTDAALWYMAGTVKFDNVTIQNFKTSTANRYALNCNNTANMTLNDVTFKDNENSAAEISPVSTDVYIDGGTLHLSGDTTANVYYAGGSIDISSLSKGCNITITANSDNYKTIAAFTAPSAAVNITADSASRSITITGSDVDYALSGEKTLSRDGALTVSATAVSYADEDKTVRVYAAAYDDTNTLVSASVSDEKELKANFSLSEELTLKASDSDTIALYLWDSATQEPLADKLTVTKIKEDNLLLFYDFENPSDTASMLFGGASVESGKGISGNGLVLNGTDGYMQLPNGILSDNMTVMGWVKTDTVQSWARFFDFGADTANNFFYSPSGGRVESVVGGASDTMDVTAYANTGIWEHYAVTRTADKVQLYRNGELVSEQSCSKPVTGITETTNYIGKSHWAADKYFCGAIDEIKIYNKICTAEEIKTMYNIYAEKLTADAAYKDYISLDFGTTELTDGTALPSVGDNGSAITWESTDSSIISGNTITGPAAGEADKPATLTATVKNGDTVYTKTF